MSSPAEADGTWDYVVVGGGAAGCVVANRLSDDGLFTVLLIEAGAAPASLAVRIPALIQKISNERNWLYPVEPDASRGGTADPYNSGRGLGGSTAINDMLWVRGHPRDYDGWAAAGCPGWDHASVVPYFRRAESFREPATAERGANGPQRVSWSRVSHRLTDAFLEAAEQSGLPRVADYNAGSPDGASRSQVTQWRGMRHTAAQAYLGRARRRPNLTVRTGALATRVLIERGRAVAVEHDAGGVRRLVSARREVVVCAGALASPKLLMLSGIGPAEHLRAVGIPVVAHLPGVGANLAEHPAASLVFEVNERTLNQDLTPVRLLRHAADFLLHGRGALTTTRNHALAFARVLPDAPVPDTEIIFMAFGVSPAGAGDGDGGSAGGLLRRLSARTGGRAEGRRQVAPDPLVTIQTAVLHPAGRGEVRLRSRDPLEPPVIRQQLLGDARDLAGLIAGARRIREISAAPGLKRHVIRERTPGNGVTTAAEWAEHLRGNVFRLSHPASTCAMGSGEAAVVDPQLRVREVAGLRVIDASIMPSLPSGNTVAPTIMIAERGSDLLRGRSA